MRDKSRAYLRCSAPSETHRFSLSFTTKAGNTGHRTGLSFPGTFRCDFFSAGAPRASSSPLFRCPRSALGAGGLRLDVCLWGQGDENKPLPGNVFILLAPSSSLLRGGVSPLLSPGPHGAF